MKVYFMLLAGLLAGCAEDRSLSTVRDEHTAYAINGSQARQIVEESLRNYVPAVRRERAPEGGFVASGSLVQGAKTQTITVSTQKVSGINSSGGIGDGYGFEVSDQGAIINQLAPSMIYSLIKQQASMTGETIATAKPEFGAAP
jgi:hypothetical protein